MIASRRCYQRWAFTLTELVVIVVLLVLLLAVLVPTVQQARESACRSQCSSNLKIYGLGLHNYADFHRRFPMGASGRYPHQSACTAIIPFWGYTTLYDQLVIGESYNPKTGGTATTVYWEQVIAGQPVRMQQLRLTSCPSDPSPRVRNGWAVTNYQFCNGNGNVDSPHSPASCRVFEDYKAPNTAFLGFSDRPEHTSGVFSRGAFSSEFKDITDGLSQTIAMGEGLEECTDQAMFFWHPWGAPVGGGMTTIPMNLHVTCPAQPSSRSELPFLACRGQTNAYAIAAGFRSQHPDGANFLFADGSTRFVRTTIDERIYRRLGARADGEVVPFDAF